MSDVFELISTKRAVREYDGRPLPEDTIRRILEAGRLSGSSKNTQPWAFIAVEEQETLSALAEAGKFARHVPSAALVVVIAIPDPSPSGTPDFDVGRAVQNMMLTAAEEGVGSVVTYLHNGEIAAEVLGVPDGYTTRWAVAFGYPARPYGPPTGRAAYEDVVHRGGW